jgi:diketogulonate reductase-like aldo/keto reductase
MPLIGVGMWQVPKDKAAGVVLEAFKLGYRLVDTASDYGNEKEIGDGIKEAFDTGLVKREDIFVTSKLWNTDHARQHVRQACEHTLKDLRLDYLDLYLIHFPISLKHVDRVPAEWFYDPDKKQVIPEPITIRETWEAMEELVDAGLVKNIGVANFSGALIVELLKFARIKPSVLQIEHNPYLTQEKLINYAKSQGLAITAYSSFANLSYISSSMDFPDANDAPLLFDQPIIKEIAKNYGKSPAQIALKWALQRQIAIIPKSSNRNRLTENRDLFDFELTQEELHKISSLNKNLRFNNPATFNFPIFE